MRAVIAVGALASLLAAPSRAADGITPGVLAERIPVSAAPEESYALYLPSGYSPSRPTPILYAFDPRARGRVPVERFQAAAERYGWAVVGSNNSRNGIAVTDIVSRLWDDTHRRLAIDERRVYMTGFSGGARVASGIALSSRGLVAGVIAFGAGLPSGVQMVKDAPFVFFGGAGRDDFNLPEMRHLAADLDAAAIPNRLETWDGGHEWAPPELCTLAVEWLELSAMRAGTRGKDGGLVEQWARRDEERARQQETAGAAVEAAEAFDSLAEDFRGLRDTSDYAQAAARIRGSRAYKDAVRAQREDDRRQGQLSNELGATLQQLLGDADGRLSALATLRGSIATLRRAAEKENAGREGHVARRALTRPPCARARNTAARPRPWPWPARSGRSAPASCTSSPVSIHSGATSTPRWWRSGAPSRAASGTPTRCGPSPTSSASDGAPSSRPSWSGRVPRPRSNSS